MTLFALDCSNHDWRRGPMDLAAIRRAGIPAMTHKATDGNRFYRDPYFPAAMARGRAAGLVTGAYHVLWPGDPRPQANWFMQVVDLHAPWWRTSPFLFQIDAERFDYFTPARPPSIAEINGFGDAVHALTGGRAALAYAPDWLYHGALGGLRWPLWASNYGTNPAGHYTALYPGDFSTRWRVARGAAPLLLQYGSRATIATQPGCDITAFRGTLPQLLAAAGAPADQPTEDTEEEDDMFLVPPTEIADRAPAASRSHVIPPVNAGGLKWGPAWLTVGGDLYGRQGRFRLAVSGGNRDWLLVRDRPDVDDITVESGQTFTTQLPDGTRLLSFTRVPVDQQDDCSGCLSFGIEYGRRA